MMIEINDKTIYKTIKKRPNNSHKGTFGKVCIIGGNQNYGGAAIMATKACVYSGAGLTTTFTNIDNLNSLHNQIPEAMFANLNNLEQLKSMLNSFDVVLIGPGLGTDEQSYHILKCVFKTIEAQQILIVDGSAITLIAHKQMKLPKAHIIFTPHEMEWQRLSGIKINEQTDVANQDVVNQLNSMVVLKSHRTKVYDVNGPIFINTKGTPAQATGGMGDTLAGMIAGFVAQFKDTDKATLAAVYIHSEIAEFLAQDQYVVLPTQIIKLVPRFMKIHEF
jgi:ADP-dependent NAD(P)H-hydrate dehydratase